MGLLTDPRAENGKVIKFVLQWEKIICYTLYFTGIIWSMLLALPNFNDSTFPNSIVETNYVKYFAFN